MDLSRSPHGERGLKSKMRGPPYLRRLPSLPSRGAWIEILETICNAFAQSSRYAWTLVDGTVRYQCESPANTTASVVLPNDFKLTAANMAKYSPKSQDGVIMIHLGSGSYTFG